MTGPHHPTGTRGQRQLEGPINFHPGPSPPCRRGPRPNGGTRRRTRRLHPLLLRHLTSPLTVDSCGSCWPGPATGCSDCRRNEGTGTPGTPHMVKRQLLVTPPGNFLEIGSEGVLQIFPVPFHLYGAPESIDRRPYPPPRFGPHPLIVLISVPGIGAMSSQRVMASWVIRIVSEAKLRPDTASVEGTV